MTWAVFIVAVAATPIVGRWLRRRPDFRTLAWTVAGFLPFYAPLDLSLLFFAAYPGDTHGIEFALLDWFALTLFFAHQGRPGPLPYRHALAFYFVMVILSATQAQWLVLSLAYAWKLVRMYFLFAAICRVGDDDRVPVALLRGMTYGIIYEGGLAAWQHYGEGLFQATGSFSHQNTLGVLMNLVVMAPIALAFAGPTKLAYKLAPAAALAAGLFTVSRGALLFLGVGTALVYLGSVSRRSTPRKTWIGLVGVALAAAMVPLALSTLASRSTEERTQSLELRERLEVAASLMLREHPLGIGPNSFQSTLLLDGYGERAGVHWSARTAIVHNVYALTAAEMGHVGVLALLLLFAGPLIAALRHGLWSRRDRRGDVLLGLGVGLLVFHLHGLFEWVWRLTEVGYVYFMVIAVVAVLDRQVREAGRTASGPRVERGAPAGGARLAVVAGARGRSPAPSPLARCLAAAS